MNSRPNGEPTMARILAEAKQKSQTEDSVKSMTVTEKIERFPGIGEYGIPEIRETEFISLLDRYGWSFITGNGTHNKMQCRFVNLIRNFAPSHSKKKKKIIEKGELDHLCKIYGLARCDIIPRFRIEARIYAYVERFLTAFPEHLTTLRAYLTSLARNYSKGEHATTFRKDYWKLLELTESPPSDISLKYIPKFESPEEAPQVSIAPNIVESKPTDQETEAELVELSLEALEPKTNESSPKVEVIIPLAKNLDMPPTPPIKETSKITSKDPFTIQTERVFEYLSKKQVNAFKTLEEWDRFAKTTSMSHGIKKSVVEIIFQDLGYQKPEPAPLPIVSDGLPPFSEGKCVVTPAKIEPISSTTKFSQVFLLKKEGKCLYAFAQEDLAKMIAKAKGAEIEVVKVNHQSFEEFIEPSISRLTG